MKARLVKFTCPATIRKSEFVSFPSGTTDAEITAAFQTWLAGKTDAAWTEEPAEPDLKRAASGERDDDEP